MRARTMRLRSFCLGMTFSLSIVRERDSPAASTATTKSASYRSGSTPPFASASAFAGERRWRLGADQRRNECKPEIAIAQARNLRDVRRVRYLTRRRFVVKLRVSVLLLLFIGSLNAFGANLVSGVRMKISAGDIASGIAAVEDY